MVLRGRIDAVFAAGADGVDVVDWKTGRPPTGARLRAAAVQLAVYRLAWSRLTGLPLDRVGAAFFYASTGQTLRPADGLTERDLEVLVESVVPAE
jgi:DNA helicase-2/ATP-dependent DNA helicase PcrA